jgi:hypothetical protein
MNDGEDRPAAEPIVVQGPDGDGAASSACDAGRRLDLGTVDPTRAKEYCETVEGESSVICTHSPTTGTPEAVVDGAPGRGRPSSPYVDADTHVLPEEKAEGAPSAFEEDHAAPASGASAAHGRTPTLPPAPEVTHPPPRARRPYDAGWRSTEGAEKSHAPATSAPALLAPRHWPVDGCVSSYALPIWFRVHTESGEPVHAPSESADATAAAAAGLDSAAANAAASRRRGIAIATLDA